MMAVPRMAGFGKDYLQQRIARDFPLARHIGIVVDAADDAAIVLRAPLPPNSNDKGTAFGGSLYSVAVLTGWSWVARYLAAHELTADAVIQESTIRYLAPVDAELCASLVAPADAQVDKFRKMMQRAGRGRIRLRVDIYCKDAFATHFEGVFAAALR
jgi:thioesterase domain-containing protein